VVIFCCFGATILAASSFVVVGGDDTAVVDVDVDVDVDGIAAAVVVLLFTVLGTPHIRASVVLTTLRLGLPGAHIIALTSGDIVVLREECVGDNGVAENEVCWAYTLILLQIPKIKTPLRSENSVKIELILLINNV
jgi:hypothetical protein